MLLLASVLVIGMLLGWGLGGGVRHLAKLEVRFWWLIPLALVLQIAPVPRAESGPGRYIPFALLLLSFLMIAAVMLINWRHRGFLAILLGVLLNLIPIALNQGMPVSGPAVVEAGGSLSELPRERGGKHHLQSSEDVVTVLGDVIAVRSPFRAVVSIGDLVMWAGAGWFVTAAMLGVPLSPLRLSRSPARMLRSSKT